MIVKHIGVGGRVRRTFEDVHSIRYGNNSLVILSRRYAEPTGHPFFNDYPIALINLAPGESVEREDEPTRS
jgi:hypothetical protein